jgi:hypothetical protein
MLVALIGTVIFGAWQVTVTATGIFWVSLNMFMTCTDRLLQAHYLQDKNFTVSIQLCMVWNNLLGTVPILAMAVVTGQLSMWPSMVVDASMADWSSLFLSCICGLAIGFLGLKCQKAISATSFLMLQNFSKVFLIFVSMGYFGDAMWGISAFGCILSMFGTMWYSYERLPAETAKSDKDALEKEAADAAAKLKDSPEAGKAPAA